jgi:O-antigen ligase
VSAGVLGRSPRPGISVPLLAVLAAAAIGFGVTVKPTYAVALVVAAVVGLVVVRDVGSLPLLLVFTMFVESLSLGGALRIGRVAGALALLAVVYYLLDRGRAGLRANVLLGAIAGWGIWALLSVYWASFSGSVYSTLTSYLLGIAYTLAFALLVRTPRQLHSIFMVLAVGSLVFGVISFAEFATASGSARASGLQGDPNYFAVYQVIALPATLVLAAFERRAQRRLLLYGVVGVIVLSVVSSLSRTGVIALLLVVVATLVLPSRLFFARPGRKVVYLLAIVAAGTVAVGVGSTAFVSRVQSIFSATDASGDRGAGRTDLWAAAWHGYSQHPWLGLGAGNFTPEALELLQTTPGVDTQRNYITSANVVHNGYLEQLTELGPVGLALWLSILLFSGRYLIRAARRARAAGDQLFERYATAAAVALAGYAVSVFFLSNELGKPIWIFAGLALALDVSTRRWQPLLAKTRPYHRGVSDPVVERELELERRLEALRLDQERFDRRRAALDERERELAARERSLGAPAPVTPAPVTPAPVTPTPAPVLTPVPVPAEQGLVLQPELGRWNLSALEAAMAAQPHHPRAEEWEAYALFLRDHVDEDGLLPYSFDELVVDVYADLIAGA